MDHANSGAEIKWQTLHRLVRDVVLDHGPRQLVEKADEKKDLIPLNPSCVQFRHAAVDALLSSRRNDEPELSKELVDSSLVPFSSLARSFNDESNLEHLAIVVTLCDVEAGDELLLLALPHG